MPVKHMFSCSKVRRNTFHPFSKISTDIFSLLNFKVSSHGQFMNFFVEKILLAWCGCQLLWIHGSWVQEISSSSSHGQLHRRLTTSGYLGISHCRCLAHQLGSSDLCQSGLVQILGSCVHECQEKFLEQSYTHLCSVRTWCMWSCWNSLHVVHSVECLHVVRTVESHICPNCLRIHLECVHPNYFGWKSNCMDMLSNKM